MPAALRRLAASDEALLALLVAVSLLPYLAHLGWSSDDWEYLGALAGAPDRELPTLFARLDSPNEAMRPLRELYLFGLLLAFGESPLGAHRVNAAMLVVAAVLLLRLFRGAGVPRAAAFLAALLFAVLPGQSTNRLWFSGFQILPSLALLFAALALDLGPRPRRPLLALAGLVASGLLYEVALPFFLLGPALGLRRAAPGDRRPWIAALLARAAAVAALLAFKAATTIRLHFETFSDAARWYAGYLPQLVRFDVDRRAQGLNLPNAFAVHFGDHGLLLGRAVRAFAADGPGPAALLASLLVGLGAAFHAFRHAGPVPARRLVALGIALFLGGWAMFVTNPYVDLANAGLGNRTAAAALVGVALAFAALLAALARVRPAGALAVFAFVSSATFVSAAIGDRWARASSRAADVLADVRRALPDPAPDTTVLLDGVCRYDGPAIVFEAWWDLSGALTTAYHREIRGEIVTANLRVDADGLVTDAYGEPHRTPFRHLVAYDGRRRDLVPLPDRAAVERYLAERDPDRTGGCPAGFAAHGVPLY